MRNAPEDDGDREELSKLNAAPWMVAALDLNPSYTSWGPDEDYMMAEDAGWRSPMRLDRWADRPSLDDLNEAVNFYFEIRRESKPCDACESGYSRMAQRFHDEWYGKVPFDRVAYGAGPLAADHPSIVEFARRNVANGPDYYGRDAHAVTREAARLHRMFAGQWNHGLIQADVDALIAADRLWDLTRVPLSDEQRAISQAKIAAGGNSWLPEGNGHRPTADEVNAWSMRGMGHDSINAWVCIKARCEREGAAVECARCGGAARLYTAPAAHLALIVWLLHPRKGASRGVEIKRIEEGEMPDVLRWLSDAAKRNADRFAAVVAAKEASK